MKLFIKLSGSGSILFGLILLLLVQKSFAEQEEECGVRAAIEQFWSEVEPVQRPALQNEQTIGTIHFIIHYSLSDPNHATTLQWAQEISNYAEECWTISENLGWTLSPPDNGNGGDDRYDIYVMDTGSNNGSTVPESLYTTPYLNGFSSWMAIRRDPVPNQQISDSDRLKVLVAHEFHHGCQFRHILLATEDAWFYENTSVLMEKVFYPEINFLKFRLADPVSPLLTPQWAINHILDSYPYPGGLWALFLNEYYSDENVVRYIWETVGNNPSLDILSGIDQTLTQQCSSDLVEALKYYAVWRYFTGSRADNNHFSDAHSWPTSAVMTIHSTYPVHLTQILDITDSPGGTTYLQFYNGNFSCLDLTLDGEDGLQWSAFAIEDTSSRPGIETEIPLDSSGFGQITVPWVEQEHIALIPILIDWQNPVIRRDYAYSAEHSQYAVSFLNRISENNAGGELLLDEAVVIPSGERRCFSTVITHTVKTLNERFGTAPTYKHNQWLLDPNVYFLSDQFDPLEPYQYAEFKQLNATTVLTDLLSSGGSSNGIIEFHDPWFVETDGTQPDDFLPFPSPHYPTGHRDSTTGGVFLNQDYGDPGVPYYSVRAPQQQAIPFHGESIGWYFQHWDGNDVDFQDSTQTETAVVFRQPDAEAHAVYKGHLASSNSAATGANNARRMIRDEEGTLHAVYEDGHRIWYTHTIDQQFGQAWVPEQVLYPAGPLSGEGYLFQYLYPCLVEYVGTLHAAFTELLYVEGELDQAAVIYRRMDISQGEWEDHVEVANFPLSELSATPMPAIEIIRSSTDVYVVISFNQPDHPSQIRTYYKLPADNHFTPSSSLISGSNPSLSSDADHFYLRLAYQSQGEIYHRNWLKETRTWGAAGRVSVDTWVYSEQTPNISFDVFSYTSHLVWAGISDELIPYAVYRTYGKSGNPGTPCYFGAGGWQAPLPHPTVAELNGKPTIFYEEDGIIIKRWFDGENWLEECFEEGRFPGMVAHGQNDAFWTTDPSAPYRLKTDYRDPESERLTLNPGPPDTLMVNKRFDFTLTHDTTAGYLTLEVRNLRLAKRRITLDDSLLLSQPLTIPPNEVGEYTLLCRFKNVNFPVDSQTVLIKVEFTSGNKTHRLRQLRLGDLLAYNNGQYHLLPVQLPLQNLSGKSGRFRIAFDNLQPAIGNMVVRRDSAGTQGLALNKGFTVHTGSAPALPNSFRLYQNYPNPFNPATTIAFDLPRECRVMITIYDLAGRKVRSLWNGTLPAGSHRVVWHGDNERGVAVAGGVYLYHLTAGEFTATRKMILMR